MNNAHWMPFHFDGMLWTGLAQYIYNTWIGLYSLVKCFDFNLCVFAILIWIWDDNSSSKKIGQNKNRNHVNRMFIGKYWKCAHIQLNYWLRARIVDRIAEHFSNLYWIIQHSIACNMLFTEHFDIHFFSALVSNRTEEVSQSSTYKKIAIALFSFWLESVKAFLWPIKLQFDWQMFFCPWWHCNQFIGVDFSNFRQAVHRAL